MLSKTTSGNTLGLHAELTMCSIWRLGHVSGAWGGGGDRMGVCPTSVLTVPEAASLKVLWHTCQLVPRSPVGLGATRPSQTLGNPGAVKPDTCPCTCTHAYTPMSLHGPDPGPYTKQSVEYLHSPASSTAGPTTHHGVRDTWAVMHCQT